MSAWPSHSLSLNKTMLKDVDLFALPKLDNTMITWKKFLLDHTVAVHSDKIDISPFFENVQGKID